MRLSNDYRWPGFVTRRMQQAGLTNRRNLIWAWFEPRNFGDWVGPLLFEAYTGQPPLPLAPARGWPARGYMTAGSILGELRHDDQAIVWGSGVLSREDRFARPREIRALRGPFSAERCRALGYPCPDILGDPAILLPEVVPGAPERGEDIGVVAHYVDAAIARRLFAGVEGVRLIDVTRPVQEVVAEITACAATVSSSLHGLIVSHAYGVPSAWVRFSDGVLGDGTKFDDYYASCGVETPLPTPITAPWPHDRLAGLAAAAPLPDQAPLRGPLTAARPF